MPATAQKEGKLQLQIRPEEPQLVRGGGKAQGPRLKPRGRRASQRKNPDRNREPDGDWKATAAADRAMESRRRTWKGRPGQVQTELKGNHAEEFTTLRGQ